jgi:hypothetical protein
LEAATEAARGLEAWARLLQYRARVAQVRFAWDGAQRRRILAGRVLEELTPVAEEWQFEAHRRRQLVEELEGDIQSYDDGQSRGEYEALQAQVAGDGEALRGAMRRWEADPSLMGNPDLGPDPHPIWLG